MTGGVRPASAARSRLVLERHVRSSKDTFQFAVKGWAAVSQA